MYGVKFSKYSREIFDNYLNIERGKIHSMFNKSLNIKTPTKIINIIENNDSLSPFSIGVDKESMIYFLENLSLEDTIYIDYEKKHILFETLDLILELSDEGYDCSINKVEKNNILISHNIKIVSSFIKNISKVNGFDKDNEEFVDRIIHPKETSNDEFYDNINKLKNIVLYGKKDDTVFDYFVGRGKGLTPSGDDFLVGLISTLKMVDEDKISNYLYEYLELKGIKRTTDISLEYLMYACSGKVSNSIIDLCRSIISTKLYTENLIDRVANTGSTSGIDTLLGMLLGFSIINN